MKQVFLTGKKPGYGGSLARKEATGYGLVYFVEEMLRDEKESFLDKTVVVSGSGNVAIYAIEKAQHFGAKVVACSDSNGYIYDPEGIDLNIVKEIKEVKGERIKTYLNIVQTQHIQKVAQVFGQFHVISPFHVQHKMKLTANQLVL